MAPDGSVSGGSAGSVAVAASAIDVEASQAQRGVVNPEKRGEPGNGRTEANGDESNGRIKTSGKSGGDGGGAGSWEEPRSRMWEWRENWMVHYEVAGDETDRSLPAVLLLPGFGVGSFHFQQQLRGLAAGAGAGAGAGGAAGGAAGAESGGESTRVGGGGGGGGGQEGGEAQQRYRVWAMDFFGQGKSWPAKDPAPFPAPAAAAAPPAAASASAAALGSDRAGRAAEEEEALLLRGAEEGRGGQTESRESSESTEEVVADWGFGPRAEPWARDLVYGSDMWCEQVAAFISQVIQEPVFIAGNSLGGYIGAYLAASHPHLCRGLMLLNATPFWAFAPNPAAPAPSLLARLYPFSWRGSLPVPTLARVVARRWWDSLRHPTTLRSLLTLVYTDPSPLTPALIDSIAQPTQHPASAAAFASILFAPKARLSFDENLSSITARALPVCIIHGRDDPWVGPMWAARAARALPHAAFFELSPAGHCPHHERPQVVNYLISSWVSHVHSNFSTPLPLSPEPHSTHSHSDSPSAASLASSSSSSSSQPSTALPWSFPSLLGEGEWEEGVWIDGVGLHTSSAEKQGDVTEPTVTVKSSGGSQSVGAGSEPWSGIQVRRHMKPPPHPIHLVDAAVETVSATWRRITGKADAGSDNGRKKSL
ncbi:unnamed protein product [Closterium sp. Naga37s-1]|nr:unnamed protein product [Closterium sp. Naga37s-1]